MQHCDSYNISHAVVSSCYAVKTNESNICLNNMDQKTHISSSENCSTLSAAEDSIADVLIKTKILIITGTTMVMSK